MDPTVAIKLAVLKRVGGIAVRGSAPAQEVATHAVPQAECILTPRQRGILRLMSIGLTNREILECWRSGVRTVEVHRFNLKQRLKVRNIVQLFHRSIELELIDEQGKWM
jgi:DNA-binding NarL/FixJ family response regulator